MTIQSSTVRNIVLCVDDEQAVLSLLQSALMVKGYAVLVASDGPKALKLMSGRRVDAIVLDYFMPGMNGGQVAVEMKRMRPDTPIILFSGSCDIPSSALKHVDAFVEKEKGVHSLLSVLRQLLESPLKNQQAVRKFPRFSVQVPIVVTVMRSGKSSAFQGLSCSVGEGGLGGRISGNLIPGEYVRIRISDKRLETALEPHAQVRYRKNEIYGFAFLEGSILERATVQRLCGQLASA